MFCRGLFSGNVTVNVNGSRCYPFYTPFLYSSPMMNMWTNMFFPTNFLSYNAGFRLGNFVGGKVLNFLC